MANLFPPVIKYAQDFDPNDLKTVQLERTTAEGRKIKSQLLKFDGGGIEMLLYCRQRFDDAMETQAIDEDEWHEEFG